MMKNFEKLFLLIFLGLLSIMSCKKDMDITPPVIDTETNIPPIIIKGNLIGKVIDHNNQPLSSAMIQIYGQTIETNQDGFFTFNQIDLDKNGSYLTVNKSGFFQGHKRFYPQANNTTYVEIKLLEKTKLGKIESQTGGSVSNSEGAKIELPANGIIDSNGEIFSGNVNVFATSINPKENTESIPGNLEGYDVQNNNIALESFGTLGVELESDSGEKLNIATGFEAKISIPYNEANSSPSREIALWHFDETKGIWKEEGSATYDGQAYVGTVSHFSFWSCNESFPVILLDGYFVDENDLDIPNLNIKITNLSTGNSRYTKTSNLGVFSGKVPKDELLNIYLISDCGEIYYEEEIGPFSERTSLGILTFDNFTDKINSVTIEGRVVDCDGDAMNEVLLELNNVQGEKAYFYVDGNGFKVSTDFCENSDSINMVAYDLSKSTELTSIPITIYTDSLDQYLGDLALCPNDEAFIKFKIGQDSYTYNSIDVEKNKVFIVGEQMILLGGHENLVLLDSSRFGLIAELNSFDINTEIITSNPELNLFDLSGKFPSLGQRVSIFTEGEKRVSFTRIGGVGGYVQGKMEFDASVLGAGFGLSEEFKVATPGYGMHKVEVEFSLIRKY